MRAFEAFKETNDERLSAMERRGAGDTLVSDKLARIDRTLDETKRVADELALKASRPRSRLWRRRWRRPPCAITGARSRAMCARARPATCAISERKLCRSARMLTAAISFRTRPSAPSTRP